jgi:predicted ATPase
VIKGHASAEVERCYLKARELCLRVGETTALAPILFGLLRFYNLRSSLKTARELGEILLRVAQHDPSLSVVAHYALGVTGFYSGAFVDCRQHVEEGIQRYTLNLRRAPVYQVGGDLGVGCRMYAGSALWFLGYPDQSAVRLHGGLMMASELSHPFTLAFARCWAAMCFQWRRDLAATLEHAEAALALSTEHGFPHWAALGTLLRGWALVMRDKSEEGMAQLSQGIAAWRRTGAALSVHWLLTLLAEASSILGHFDEGLRSLDEAQALLEQQEDRWWEGETYRLRGVLLLRQSIAHEGDAESLLRRAQDISRRQQAKSLELRAAINLAHLSKARGDHSKALDLLSPVYCWFTEGFDTLDLAEAKALLDELAQTGEEKRRPGSQSGFRNRPSQRKRAASPPTPKRVRGPSASLKST